MGEEHDTVVGGGGAGLPYDTTLSHERGTNTYCRPAKELRLR